MIVGSVLLVLAAAGLLVSGLIRADSGLLYSSIGVSGLAALALVVGVHRLIGVRAGQVTVSIRPGAALSRIVAAPAGSVARRTDPPVRPASGPVPARPVGRASPRPVGRATPRPMGRATPPPPPDGMVAADLDALAELDDAAVPFDEPAEEVVAQYDAARLRLVTAEVVVVDGRPRYHLSGCLHLLGFDVQRLPANDAEQGGFTPCALCRPAIALLRAEPDA